MRVRISDGFVLNCHDSGGKRRRRAGRRQISATRSRVRLSRRRASRSIAAEGLHAELGRHRPRKRWRSSSRPRRRPWPSASQPSKRRNERVHIPSVAVAAVMTTEVANSGLSPPPQVQLRRRPRPAARRRRPVRVDHGGQRLMLIDDVHAGGKRKGSARKAGRDRGSRKSGGGTGKRSIGRR